MRREVGDILGFGLNRCDESGQVYIESIKQVRLTLDPLLWGASFGPLALGRDILSRGQMQPLRHVPLNGLFID